MIDMERKIGEIFEFGGEWYQCVEHANCCGCGFVGQGECHKDIRKYIGICRSGERDDSKSVIFKKLEKVGEPFTLTIHVEDRLVPMQEYKLYDVNFCKENDLLMYVSDYKHKRISIEIKQTKEDMEEKKLNLKPFDIQKAREGKPVCTRDGRKARIICFDKGGEQPIVALIEKNEEESIDTFFSNGHSVSKTNEVAGDLMMLPEKHEGWINIVKNADDYYYCKGVFDSEEHARNNEANYTGLAVATVKIEWEE